MLANLALIRGLFQTISVVKLAVGRGIHLIQLGSNAVAGGDQNPVRRARAGDWQCIQPDPRARRQRGVPLCGSCATTLWLLKIRICSRPANVTRRGELKPALICAPTPDKCAVLAVIGHERALIRASGTDHDQGVEDQRRTANAPHMGLQPGWLARMSRDQISAPLARSRQLRMPVAPSVKTRSPAMVGVARGPTPATAVS